MKIVVLGLTLLVAAFAVAEVLPSVEYLPPVQEIETIDNGLSGLSGFSGISGLSGTSGLLTDDGYRYKTVRRLRVHRHRRDVNELPSSEYLPPVQQQVSYAAPAPVQQVSYAPAPVQQVSVPSNEYLAPIAPAAEVAQVSSGVLADDGYRYKTVKRYRLRHRRDVNELPSSEYLPPVQQQVSYAAPAPVQQVSYAAPAPIQQINVPSNEYLAPIAPAAEVAQVSSGVLADDGYRYKTVKRYRLRHRRDVNELPSSEYLPPVQQQVSYAAPAPVQQQVSYAAPAPIQQVSVPSNEYLAPIAPAAEVAQVSSGVLADDGYRYKTVKRYRLRHRRDVNELPSSEYLPPVQQQVSYAAPAPVQQVSYAAPAPIQQVSVPSNEYLAPIAPSVGVAQVSSGVLADDGYRYKTVKRYRLRHRRDVNELPSSEYLPPVQQQVSYAAPVQQQVSYAAPAPIQQQVSYAAPAPIQQVSVPSNEYLAPIAPAAEVAQVSSGVLADDGYRYRTVKRYRLRHRRDVSELPSTQYLPPVQQQIAFPQVAIQQPAIQTISAALPSTQYLAPIDVPQLTSNSLSGVLADDGYRYKTVKKFKRRH